MFSLAAGSALGFSAVQQYMGHDGLRWSFGSRAAGNKKFDTAQLAVLLKKKIGLTATG